MAISVAVAGASGYAGGEALRLALNHPEIEIGALTGHSSAGDRLGLHHPHLVPLADRIIEPTTAQTLSGHDAVILALPHGASGPIAKDLDPETLVLDCGADFRLANAQAWQDFYGSNHAGTWPYGMPELITDAGRQRENLRDERRIAVPGCNVTAVTLALAPGVAAGVVDAADIVAVLANGPSGAGKAAKTNLLASEILGSAAPYAVGGTHRHIPEIQQNLKTSGASEVRISFTPTLVPMARGILATVTAPLNPQFAPDQVRRIWVEAYVNEPFVAVLPEGQWPSTAQTLGSNTAAMQITVDERANRVVAICALDNLVKGTAGTAIQCLNLAFGWPETTGLTAIGLAP
ncbi:MAG TPA: N-acetyl-gamma-glutamyl-phosphate reductase [Actinomycetales bacterium]|nr:N-acetyl-gamma-glutamyl-phosphate reductase [Actinomycetales bacterium]